MRSLIKKKKKKERRKRFTLQYVHTGNTPYTRVNVEEIHVNHVRT